MHIPEHFRLEDRAQIHDIARRYDFALLVTTQGGVPQASHLPLIFDAGQGAEGTILGHMARGNPQWRDFAALADSGSESMAVFQGPHAYISPTWYGGEGSRVPTWNYVALHAYGLPRVIEDPGAVRALLERLVETQEAERMTPWRMDSQSENYLAGMMRGIVAFEMPVTRLEAKAKLSQNREPEAALGAAAGLEQEGSAPALETAAWMRRSLMD